LAGYLRPDSGEIIIDGQKLSEVKFTDYYRHIGYLSQEPSVFDGTVYENLTYALEEDNINNNQIDQKIHEIIKLSKCEFIYEFEQGLQTEIGER
jgi:ABC-type multidrug transport system fused ATPase/permease subunit